MASLFSPLAPPTTGADAPWGAANPAGSTPTDVQSKSCLANTFTMVTHIALPVSARKVVSVSQMSRLDGLMPWIFIVSKAVSLLPLEEIQHPAERDLVRHGDLSLRNVIQEGEESQSMIQLSLGSPPASTIFLRARMTFALASGQSSGGTRLESSLPLTMFKQSSRFG